MADIVSPEIRSRMMSGIRGKNTQPELLLRRLLHQQGFRYRIHVSNLPGRPDMVFPKYRAAIFAHGCFWHGHSCHLFRLPASRTHFWKHKIDGNRLRDKLAMQQLHKDGWRTLTVWECALKGRSKLSVAEIAARCGKWLRSENHTSQIKGRRLK